MQKPRWLTLVAILGVFALVGAACNGDGGGGGGGTPDGDERIEVTVYGQGAWTGGANGLVLPSMQSAQIRFDELNAEEGYPATITFEQADTQGSGDAAPPVAQGAAEDPNTVAIMGPAFSGESRATGDTYNDAGIPFVTASATGEDLADFDWDFWYRTVGHDGLQSSLAARWVAEVIQPESLFILHDTTDYGQPLAESVEAAATDAGITIAGKTGIPEPAINTGVTVDFSSIISDIADSGADAVFFGGYDVDSGPFLDQAATAELDVQLISGDGSVSSSLLELAGPAAEGALLLAPSNISAGFVEKYQAEVGGEGFSVAIYSAEGYDAAGLIGEGIKVAIDGGAETPEDIRTGIKEYLDGLTEDAPFEGEAKSIFFDADTHELGHEAEELYYFYEVVQGDEALELQNLGNAVEVLG
ncbi:MAG: branched-chain amino acid ABC transporter substrate-binding protein [Actinomycetota bacterium]